MSEWHLAKEEWEINFVRNRHPGGSPYRDHSCADSQAFEPFYHFINHRRVVEPKENNCGVRNVSFPDITDYDFCIPYSGQLLPCPGSKCLSYFYADRLFHPKLLSCNCHTGAITTAKVIKYVTLSELSELEYLPNNIVR